MRDFFMHIRMLDKESHSNPQAGALTVCIHADGGAVSVGFAWCKPGEQFCRKTGCKLARARVVALPASDLSRLNVVFNSIEASAPSWAAPKFYCGAFRRKISGNEKRMLWWMAVEKRS